MGIVENFDLEAVVQDGDYLAGWENRHSTGGNSGAGL